MSARDDLAKLVFIADNHAAYDAEGEWEILQKSPQYLQYAYAVADAIIAAGYEKRP